MFARNYSKGLLGGWLTDLRNDLEVWRGEIRWVDQLHRHLEYFLKPLLARQVKVWQDRELRGNDDFSETSPWLRAGMV